jgi:pyruvate-ferredoxin/flavodoxin oxidoreductase
VQAGAIRACQVPRFFSGVYGLGSRDFRPEHILGAYEFATGTPARQDGRTAADGETLLRARRRPSLRGDLGRAAVAAAGGAIAVRLHSIGGWGMITTGKNLGEIIGELGEHAARRDGNGNAVDEYGRQKESSTSAPTRSTARRRRARRPSTSWWRRPSASGSTAT